LNINVINQRGYNMLGMKNAWNKYEIYSEFW